MDLERLEIFIHVVELGSMRAAAAAVHLTQPAVSRNIKLLEQQLGADLFRRKGRGLALTAAGRALVPHARKLLEMADGARREVIRSAERAYFNLRLGTVDSVATFLLPELLTRIQQAFPALVVRLNTGRTTVLLERVKNDMLDLAIVAYSGAPEGVRARRVGPYDLQFYGRADRYAPLRLVKSETELGDFPVVEIEPPKGVESAEPPALMSYARASNIATVKALVMAGFGVGDLVDFMLSPEEKRQLVAAQIGHDPDCGLFVVGAPGFVGDAEERIEARVIDELTACLQGTPSSS
jgi:DNA-binding transcriptional LysR family regulator